MSGPKKRFEWKEEKDERKSKEKLMENHQIINEINKEEKSDGRSPGSSWEKLPLDVPAADLNLKNYLLSGKCYQAKISNKTTESDVKETIERLDDSDKVIK